MSLTAATIALTPITTLEEFLNERKRQLDEEVRKLSTLALEPNLLNLKIDGCVALSWAIANMQVAYSSSLITLIAKVDKAVEMNLELLAFMQENLLKGGPELLISISRRVQELINSLPLSGLPKLSRIEGYPVAQGEAELSRCVLKFQGRFPNAEDAQCSPFLVTETAKRPAKTSKIGYLEFGHDLKCLPDKPVCIPVTLMVPSFTVLWQRYDISYPILLKILPRTIGDIFVQSISIPNSGAFFRENCETPVYNVSVPIAEHPSWQEWEYEIPVEDGWGIIPNTVQICVHDGSMGCYKIMIVYLSTDLIRLKVALSASDPYGEGRIYFIVKYVQATRRLICDTKNEKIKASFSWGETESLELNFKNKMVRRIGLKTLDGALYHFFPGISSEANHGFFSLGQGQNPYLRMEQMGSELFISTPET